MPVPVHKKFKNERGNEITIVISGSTNPLEMPPLSFVFSIGLIGPTSISENRITRKEAEVLRDLLIEALSEEESS